MPCILSALGVSMLPSPTLQHQAMWVGQWLHHSSQSSRLEWFIDANIYGLAKPMQPPGMCNTSTRNCVMVQTTDSIIWQRCMSSKTMGTILSRLLVLKSRHRDGWPWLLTQDIAKIILMTNNSEPLIMVHGRANMSSIMSIESLQWSGLWFDVDTAFCSWWGHWCHIKMKSPMEGFLSRQFRIFWQVHSMFSVISHWMIKRHQCAIGNCLSPPSNYFSTFAQHIWWHLCSWFQGACTAGLHCCWQ